jgi:ankyrin repeat protein
MWAAAQRHPEAVKVLLEHGADVHARSEVWSQLWQTVDFTRDAHPDQRIWVKEGGYTPLLFAARVGDLASAKLLVAAGANINDTAASGLSTILLAVQSVIDYRFLPEPYRAGGLGYLSPHAIPASDGNELLEFLIEKGANPNSAQAGFTALHAAILRHNEIAVRTLVR